MCGRVVVALDTDTLLIIARTRIMQNAMRYRQSYNVTPGKYIPGMYKDNKGNVNLEAMKWGTKNKEDFPLINARAETVTLYPIFKKCIRCVIIIQGYYEWKRSQTQSNEEVIQPYYIHNKTNDEDYLFLAGLYKDVTDEVLLSFKYY
jgi:putative SOS response-associated peptidase YedK